MAFKDIFNIFTRKGVDASAINLVSQHEKVKDTIAPVEGNPAPGQPKQSNTDIDHLWAFPSWFNSTNQGIGGYNKRNFFIELRDISETNPTIQFCILQRQLQISKLKFKVQLKEDAKKAGKAQERIRLVQDLLSRPNTKEKTFYQFMMTFMNDLLTLDAVAIKPYFNANGDVSRLEFIDPAYISININSRGQIPDNAEPAYQFDNIFTNTVKNYSTDDLFYVSMNTKSSTPYGSSLVEKSISTILSLNKRREYQNGYYTEGNMPESMMSVNEKMTPKQLLEMQHYFNTFYSGTNMMAKKHKLKLIPHDFKLIQAKAPEIKSDMDDDLKREVCAIFNVPSGALVSDNNKATAEANRKQAAANGSDAYITFIEEMMTYLINYYIGYTDLKFSFIQEDSIDPLQQSQSLQLLTGGKPILRVNEAREKIGYGPDDELNTLSENNESEINATGENRMAGQKDVKTQEASANPELPNPNEVR